MSINKAAEQRAGIMFADAAAGVGFAGVLGKWLASALAREQGQHMHNLNWGSHEELPVPSLH